MIKEDEIVEVSEITDELLSGLREKGLTVREVLEILKNCQSLILRQMPIDENLNSKFTW